MMKKILLGLTLLGLTVGLTGCAQSSGSGSAATSGAFATASEGISLTTIKAYLDGQGYKNVGDDNVQMGKSGGWYSDYSGADASSGISHSFLIALKNPMNGEDAAYYLDEVGDIQKLDAQADVLHFNPSLKNGDWFLYLSPYPTITKVGQLDNPFSQN